MAYFMGQDIEVYITTEQTGWINNYVTVTDAGVTTLVSGAGSAITNIFASPLSGTLGWINPADGEYGVPQEEDLVGLDVTIGAMDEDITYFGFKQVTKAEIKKETTVSLTRKKTNLIWDAIFNGTTAGATTGGGRYGTTSGSSNPEFHGGLVEPDTQYGYRIHVVLQDGTEVMSIPGCCVQGHTVSTNVDGSADETMEFMTYITPSFGQTPDQVKLETTDL